MLLSRKIRYALTKLLKIEIIILNQTLHDMMEISLRLMKNTLNGSTEYHHLVQFFQTFPHMNVLYHFTPNCPNHSIPDAANVCH